MRKICLQCRFAGVHEEDDIHGYPKPPRLYCMKKKVRPRWVERTDACDLWQACPAVAALMEARCDSEW